VYFVERGERGDDLDRLKGWLKHRLGRAYLMRAGAWDAVLLIALYPLAFVFTAVYSDGLFLALSAGSFLAAPTPIAQRPPTPWERGVRSCGCCESECGVEDPSSPHHEQRMCVLFERTSMPSRPPCGNPASNRQRWIESVSAKS